MKKTETNENSFSLSDAYALADMLRPTDSDSVSALLPTCIPARMMRVHVTFSWLVSFLCSGTRRIGESVPNQVKLKHKGES